MYTTQHQSTATRHDTCNIVHALANVSADEVKLQRAVYTTMSLYNACSAQCRQTRIHMYTHPWHVVHTYAYVTHAQPPRSCITSPYMDAMVPKTTPMTPTISSRYVLR